jgi:hypothetical protein
MIFLESKIFGKYLQDLTEIFIENLTVTGINKKAFKDLDGIFQDF